MNDRFELGSQIAGPRAHSVCTRGTTMFLARRYLDAAKALKVSWPFCHKLSWLDVARPHEGEVQNKIRPLEGIVPLHAWTTVPNLNPNLQYYGDQQLSFQGLVPTRLIANPTPTTTSEESVKLLDFHPACKLPPATGANLDKTGTPAFQAHEILAASQNPAFSYHLMHEVESVVWVGYFALLLFGTDP
ncbi:MAG: hypothetical protein M1829_002121 [Trizodia sp. TS-e1964]|nr:MAG: hypothetical protein M1829_002121 [Trizodia sp. TS-e1964]